MCTDVQELRQLLSVNIKIQRKLLGISQEKLAELAELSSNMVNDIEGCRTWVSDKTILKIAQALKIEIYQLFLPDIEIKNADINKELILRLKKNIDTQFEKILAEVQRARTDALT
jgi:transcriptional regulator with XRE-family HTH domain